MNKSRRRSVLTSLLISLFMLCGLSACHSKSQAVPTPPEVQDVERFLSQPYDALFHHNEADFAIAYQIENAVESVVHTVRKPESVAPLVKSALDLTKDPSPKQFQDLVQEWQTLRPQLKYKPPAP